MTDEEMINSFFKSKEITKCPDAVTFSNNTSRVPNHRISCYYKQNMLKSLKSRILEKEKKQTVDYGYWDTPLC